MKDIHGQAIIDYYQGDEDATLLIHTNYGTSEEMPVEVFFREELDFTVLENLALIESQGKVLDLGAGAGAHALVLQARGFNVTAIENSPGCVQVMRQSGVNNCLLEDYQLHKGTYDTVLILMNGLGLAGKLNNVPFFLDKCMSLLNENGRLLVDSSDISYLYSQNVPRPKGYYGEVRYQYEYKGIKGDGFEWVYVDPTTLESLTQKMGLHLEILHTDETSQYLAMITK